jgi:cobalt transporter subunit CbtB
MTSSPASSTSSLLQSGLYARALPALAAVLFGLVLFVGAGFASPDILHNSTHDTRHALGLPCH